MTNQDGSGSTKPKTLSTTVISGATGVAAGAVFTFTLLPNANKVLVQTQTASAWLYALTFISCIMLLILVTGYVLLQRDTMAKTTPVMWVGMSVFAVLAVTGFLAIITTNFMSPTARVTPNLGVGTDLAALQATPPLDLAFHLSANGKFVPTNFKDPQPIPLADNSTLTIDIDHFDELKKRLDTLKSKEEGGLGILSLLKKACAHVHTSDDVYEQCTMILRSPEG